MGDDTSPIDKQWKLTQVFSDDDSSEADDDSQITSLEFDEKGDYLAVGYNCGQIVIFAKEQNNDYKYKFYTQFESHSLEFDFLTSTEIPEKINKISWSPYNGLHNSRLLLSTNDKTMKLWKIGHRSMVNEEDLDPNYSGLGLGHNYPAPKSAKKVYANGHSYNIHSVSLNCDGETFLSADDLRINLWGLDITDQSFNIVDCKPPNMEDLTEVITCAQFHPTQCSIFVYGLSKGVLRLADMRGKALCDDYAKSFETTTMDADGFFSEMISSIHDVKFSQDGRYMVTRDFMSIKVWDINQESKPVHSISIHDHLRPKLYDLYENDYLFDKFDVSFGNNDSQVISGSYQNNFFIYDINKDAVSVLEGCQPSLTTKILQESDKIDPDMSIDFNRKIQHIVWHPKQDQIAVAAENYIYLYQREQKN